VREARLPLVVLAEGKWRPGALPFKCEIQLETHRIHGASGPVLEPWRSSVQHLIILPVSISELLKK
jgi:hypothetical protein